MSLSQVFKDRRDEKGVQSDILQETLVHLSPLLSVTDALSDSFINTTAGWINSLLLPQVDQSRFQLALGEQPKLSGL